MLVFKLMVKDSAEGMSTARRSPRPIDDCAQNVSCKPGRRSWSSIILSCKRWTMRMAPRRISNRSCSRVDAPVYRVTILSLFCIDSVATCAPKYPQRVALPDQNSANIYYPTVTTRHVHTRMTINLSVPRPAPHAISSLSRCTRL